MIAPSMLSSYAMAGSVGAAVGFAATGSLGAAGVALAAGGAVLAMDAIFGAARVPEGAALAFLRQPVRFEHAVVWCVSLVVAALLAAAWG